MQNNHVWYTYKLVYWALSFRNNYVTIERPQTKSGLVVNKSLEAVASTLSKLEVLGVNLQVIEVKKLKFYIYCKKYFKRIDLFLNISETKV